MTLHPTKQSTDTRKDTCIGKKDPNSQHIIHIDLHRFQRLPRSLSCRYIRWHFKWNFMGIIFQEHIPSGRDGYIGWLVEKLSWRNWRCVQREIVPLETTTTTLLRDPSRVGPTRRWDLFANNITPQSHHHHIRDAEEEILKCQLKHGIILLGKLKSQTLIFVSDEQIFWIPISFSDNWLDADYYRGAILAGGG